MPGDSPLKHNPFAALRGRARACATPPAKPVACPERALPLVRVVVREEFDPEQNGLVVRVLGVPLEHVRSIGRQLRTALDTPVFIEGRELVVATSDCERVAALFRQYGVAEVVVVHRPAPTNPERVGKAGGVRQAEIRRGLRVAIVTKADQDTGTLTEGVVHDILTRSRSHPRGIKVRLESGEVGRVRRILGDADGR